MAVEIEDKDLARLGFLKLLTSGDSNEVSEEINSSNAPPFDEFALAKNEFALAFAIFSGVVVGIDLDDDEDIAVEVLFFGLGLKKFAISGCFFLLSFIEDMVKLCKRKL